MRRSSPGYFRLPRRPIAVSNFRCICGLVFHSSRTLREHEERCAEMRKERYLQKHEDRPA